MKTVLVLGGYGGFGARLCRRLADDGWSVLVAGRNGEAAGALARTLPNAQAVVADRNADLSPLLLQYRPDLLVDAAGPFQDSGYHVAETCIANGVHYLDLADARDFVCGISRLDAKARQAGVMVVSGCSSVPALSGAVIAELAEGMSEVRSVALSISASNRATAGASVAAAILSYAGQDVRLWQGGRWVTETGLHGLRRETYAIDGRKPFTRLVALADVPDHAIVPEVLPGRPSVVFRAGPEFSFQLRMLWLASWAVKWRFVGSLSPFAGLLAPIQRLTAGLGSDRSAMAIEVKGMCGDGAEVRRWTLVAEQGDGPEIPTLAAQLLARQVAGERIEPGARHAAGLLRLDAFETLFTSLAIRHQTVAQPYVPLYRRVMGVSFEALPQAVRRMHEVVGDCGASGRGTVRRGRSLAARFVAALMRFPPEGDHDLQVSFEERDGVERWTRDFGGHVFSSELSEENGRLVERFGPMRFSFDLPADASGLTMVMRNWSVFSVPMPLALAPKSRAREWAQGDEFCFDVPISLPLIGDVVHYRGRLRRL